MRPKRHGVPLGPDVQRGRAVDAVVLGSGAGAAPLTLALVRAGYRVVVLEKGPAYDQRDFINDEIRTSRRDFFIPFPSNEPHVRVDAGRRQITNEGWTANCVGGGTVHMAGFTYRLHPEDLRLGTLLGPIQGATHQDWPISWEELESYYDRIEVEIGVSGDGSNNPFEKRRRPFPLPPLQASGMARLVEQACRSLGFHPYPTARMIVSRAWQGRARCQLSHFCASYGCETGAKSSTLAAVWPKALATGRLQIRPLSMAHTVELDGSGRARAVRYLDAAGTEQRLEAAVVVVACTPIETARILLRSKVPDQSGQLGRNLMLLTLGTGAATFSAQDKRLAGIDWELPFVDRSFQDFYLLDWDSSSRRKGGTVTFLFPHKNPIYTAELLATRGPNPLWGKALKQAIRHHFRETRELEFEVFSETLPLSASRVRLDDRVKDRFGLAVANFEYHLHSQSAEVNRLVMGKGLDVLRAMGGDKVRATRVAGRSPWIQSGTCRFGNDPKTSVLDRDCRFHAVPNLFVTDGSFMPTSGGGANTFTILANSLRVGERIVALGRAHGLHGAKPQKGRGT